MRSLQACGAEFLDEEGFYALLKTGVPRDKHLKDVRYDEQGHLVGGADAAEPVGLYTRTNSDASVAAAAAAAAAINGNGVGHGHGHGVHNSQDSGYGGEASGGGYDEDEPLAKKQKTWT